MSMPLFSALVLFALAPQEPAAAADWTDAHVEHLLNRAGFGAGTAEVRELVPLGREALVERLLGGGAPRGEFFVEKVMRRGDRPSMRALRPEDRKADRRERRRRNALQLADFAAWWVERMVAGADPLREKMTLFWHGHLASSQDTVKDSYAMIRQNELFYEHALGSFADLARGIVRDAAMLKYLDNDDNRKGAPNENLARELMELFLLGEGPYGERDVQEAARALTGWSQRYGEFRKLPRRHDAGVKEVLGERADLDGDELVDLLLAQDACGAFVAGRILAYFEGVEPTPERAADYGAGFAASGYDVTALLRLLFNDPAFYRDEVVANRIPSPVEHMVGTARRLGLDPPALLLTASSRALGQRLFHPPSVNGWDGNEAWITTSNLMLRANLAGVLLDVVSIDDVLSIGDGEPVEDAAVAMDEAVDDDAYAESPDEAAGRPPRRDLGELAPLKSLRSLRWRPRMSLAARMAAAGARKDRALAGALAADLLAVPVDAATADLVAAELRARRKAAGIAPGNLLRDHETAERALREVAHVLLSLPEAQLH